MKTAKIALALFAGPLLAACDANEPRAGTASAVDPQMAELSRLATAPAAEVEDSLFISGNMAARCAKGNWLRPC